MTMLCHAGCALTMAYYTGRATEAGAAVVVYEEDFSDVGEWVVIFNDQGGSASITSDGLLGSFYVEAENNFVAFAPRPALTTPAAFVLSKASLYSLDFTVDSLTGSTSYSIEIDQFDANTNYLATVFGVVPQGTFVGTDSVNLAGLPWNVNAEFILPKVTVYTGLGEQTVRFDYIGFSAISVPEPSTLLLLGLGGLLAWRRRHSGAPIHRESVMNKPSGYHIPSLQEEA